MEIELRPADQRDFAFAFQAKREALGPHVAARWGWDEAFQLDLHRRRWSERPWFIVLWHGQAIGTVSVEYGEDEGRIGEFYLLPAYQRQGIGSALLRRLLAEAAARSLPPKLEHLKWNPVGTLYRRHGFVVTGENSTHHFLVRQPQPS